jgi:methylenetetrahydrofolate reductase (NADH)
VTFASALKQDSLAVALEITPPKLSRPRVLLRRASFLGTAVHAVNVIQRQGRQSSLEASVELKNAGVEPVWHLTTRGRTVEAIETDLAAAREAGISQVLCVRGDGDGGGHDEQTVRATVEQVCRALPGALVGATLNQYTPNPKRALANLAGKLDAGARYVQTQPVYDVQALENLVRTVAVPGKNPDIVAMVMPLISTETLRLVERRLGIQVPEAYAKSVSRGTSEAWAAFGEMLERIVASPSVDGLAIMTFEPDADQDTGERVLSALRTAGAI